LKSTTKASTNRESCLLQFSSLSFKQVRLKALTVKMYGVAHTSICISGYMYCCDVLVTVSSMPNAWIQVPPPQTVASGVACGGCEQECQETCLAADRAPRSGCKPKMRPPGSSAAGTWATSPSTENLSHLSFSVRICTWQ